MSLNPDQRKYTRRILIVDDEPYNIMAIKLIIQAACDSQRHKQLEFLIDEAENG